MPQTDPRVDAYIDSAAPFAQPILRHLRAQVHQACPDVQETLKWGMPFFQWQGRTLAHMAGFKAHCALAIWLADAALLPTPRAPAMGNFGRITTLLDLPDAPALQALLRSARQAIEQSPPATRPRRRPRAALQPPAGGQ